MFLFLQQKQKYYPPRKDEFPKEIRHEIGLCSISSSRALAKRSTSFVVKSFKNKKDRSKASVFFVSSSYYLLLTPYTCFGSSVLESSGVDDTGGTGVADTAPAGFGINFGSIALIESFILP